MNVKQRARRNRCAFNASPRIKSTIFADQFSFLHAQFDQLLHELHRTHILCATPLRCNALKVTIYLKGFTKAWQGSSRCKKKFNCSAESQVGFAGTMANMVNSEVIFFIHQVKFVNWVFDFYFRQGNR